MTNFCETRLYAGMVNMVMSTDYCHHLINLPSKFLKFVLNTHCVLKEWTVQEKSGQRLSPV